MEISVMIDTIARLGRENPVIAGIVGVVLLIFMVKKPKPFFFILSLVLLMGFIFYVVFGVSTSGVSKKEDLMHQQYREVEKTR